jgi:hypothetical protein
MALRRLAFFKKNALATRDYSSPPIGFPDSQRLLGITLLFGHGRVYDWIVLAPLIALFWIHLHKSGNLKIIIAIILMFIMFFPRRLLSYTFPEIPELLLHFRVPILLGITIWLLVMSLRHMAAAKGVMIKSVP